MIADGVVPQEDRTFSISISGVEGSEGANVDPNRDTAEITITANLDDCNYFQYTCVLSINFFSMCK